MFMVILTVGLSEVPILVAAFRLCRRSLRKDGCLPSFFALCLEDTSDEAERIKHALISKLRQESLLPIGKELDWTIAVVSLDNPSEIRATIEDLLDRQPPNCKFHLHYTGGARALSVHAMEALASAATSGRIDHPYDFSYFPSGTEVMYPSAGGARGHDE